MHNKYKTAKAAYTSISKIKFVGVYTTNTSLLKIQKIMINKIPFFNE